MEGGSRGERINAAMGKIDSPVIEHYNPKYLSGGGEHLVFEIPGRDKVVAKINHMLLGAQLEFVARRGIGPTYDSYLQGLVEQKAKVRMRLNNYFPGHLLSERDTVGTIPVSQDLIAEVFPDSAESINSAIKTELTDIKTIIRIQEKLPPEAIDTKTARSFNFRRLEFVRNISATDYEELSEYLIGPKPDVSDEEMRKLFIDIAGPEIRGLYELAIQHEDIEKAIEDFLTRAAKYTNETGNILDLSGRNNVIFFDDDGQPTYLMPDVVYPSSDTANNSMEVFQVDLSRLRGQYSKPSTLLIDTLNYTRTINGLCELLGLPDRISILSKEAIDWQTIINSVR